MCGELDDDEDRAASIQVKVADIERSLSDLGVQWREEGASPGR